MSTDEMATVPAGYFGVGPVLVLGVSGGGGREELIRVDQAPASAGIGPLGSPNV